LSEEKIGTVEILKVSRHGSGLYLRLDKDLTEAFGIKKGDKIRTRLETLIRASENASSRQTG